MRSSKRPCQTTAVSASSEKHKTERRIRAGRENGPGEGTAQAKQISLLHTSPPKGINLIPGVLDSVLTFKHDRALRDNPAVRQRQTKRPQRIALCRQFSLSKNISAIPRLDVWLLLRAQNNVLEFIAIPEFSALRLRSRPSEAAFVPCTRVCRKLFLKARDGEVYLFGVQGRQLSPTGL